VDVTVFHPEMSIVNNLEECSVCCSPLLSNLIAYSCGHIIHSDCHHELISNLNQNIKALLCPVCRNELNVDDIIPLKLDMLEHLRLTSRILNNSILNEPQNPNIEYINPALFSNYKLYTNFNYNNVRLFDHVNDANSSSFPQSKFCSLLIVSIDPHELPPLSSLSIPTIPPNQSIVRPILPPTSTIIHQLPLDSQAPKAADVITTTKAVFETASHGNTYGLPFQLDELSQETHLTTASLLTALTIGRHQLINGVANIITGLPPNLDQLLSPNPHHRSPHLTVPITISTLQRISAKSAYLSFNHNSQQILHQTRQVSTLKAQLDVLSQYYLHLHKQLQFQSLLLLHSLKVQLLPAHYQSESPCIIHLPYLLWILKYAQQARPHSSLSDSDSISPNLTHQFDNSSISDNNSSFDFTPVQTSPFKHEIFQLHDSLLARTMSTIGFSSAEVLLSSPLWFDGMINPKLNSASNILANPYLQYRTAGNVSVGKLTDHTDCDKPDQNGNIYSITPKLPHQSCQEIGYQAFLHQYVNSNTADTITSATHTNSVDALSHISPPEARFSGLNNEPNQESSSDLGQFDASYSQLRQQLNRPLTEVEILELKQQLYFQEANKRKMAW